MTQVCGSSREGSGRMEGVRPAKADMQRLFPLVLFKDSLDFFFKCKTDSRKTQSEQAM